MWQWYQEIFKCTAKFEVKIYYGDGRDKRAGGAILQSLSRKDSWFDGNPERSWVIIITSYQTLNIRHGRKAQSAWQRGRKQKPTPRSPDLDWDKCLVGLFHTVVLDEAHMIRNLDPRVPQRRIKSANDWLVDFADGGTVFYDSMCLIYCCTVSNHRILLRPFPLMSDILVFRLPK